MTWPPVKPPDQLIPTYAYSQGGSSGGTGGGGGGGSPATFRAHPSTTQAIGATPTKVDLGTEDFDTAGLFDTSTSRFTAAVDGYYFFTGAYGSASALASGVLSLYKNGAVHSYGVHPVGATLYRVTVMDYIHLTAGQYVELYAQFALSSTSSGGSTDTYLAGHLVHET